MVSLSVEVSAANLLVSHWRALICCNLMSISVALSAANLSVCGNGTHLLQSGVFISSSFSCQASCWQVLISSIGSLSRGSAPVSSAFSTLFFLIFLCRHHSFPPLVASLGQWISAAFCVQPVYKTVIGCIHRHMVGTHTTAACSDVAANTTAVPCTVNAHTLTVLSGYVVSVIIRAHFRASCLRLYWLPICTKILLGRIRLHYSEHTEWRKTGIYIYEKSQLNSQVWGLLTLAPIKNLCHLCP